VYKKGAVFIREIYSDLTPEQVKEAYLRREVKI